MAYFNRGIAHYKMGELDEARKDIHEAQALGHEVQPTFLKALREVSKEPE